MKRLLPAVLLLLCAAPALAVERSSLPNGLRVFVVPQRSAPVVSVSVFLPVGRIHEPPHLAGATHFMEHMLFRATARRPGGRSEREAWGAGAKFTANTWEDFTRYEVVVPKDRIDLALDLLSDSLLTAKFLPEEVEEERRIVLEEIAKREADAELWTWEEADGLLFRPHPYGERIIGTPRSVASFTRDQLYRWYRSRYRPEGAAIVIAGDFDPAAARAGIREAFGAWKGEGPPPPPAPVPSDAFGHYQEMTVIRTGASPMIAVTAAMPDFLHADYVATRFLAEIMRGWLDQRLVRDTGGKALVTNVWYVPRLRRNLLRIRIRVATTGDLPVIRDELLRLLAEFRESKFPWGGIRNVAGNFRARELLLLQDLSTLGTVIGRAALGGYYHPDGPPEHLAAPDRYTRISGPMIAWVAGRYLDPANLRVTLLTPEAIALPPVKPAAVVSRFGRFRAPPRICRIPWDQVEPLVPPARSASPTDGEATTIELPGGARLVYLERDTLPIVGVAVVFPSGSDRDPTGKEGLAAVTLAALERETWDDPTWSLRWRLYASGDDHAFRVDRRTSRVAFTVPREDFAETLGAVLTMLKRPSFSPAALRAAQGGTYARARRAKETVGTFAEQAFRRGILGDSPTTHPVYGSPGSIAAIAVEDIQRFHSQHLALGRAVIAVVGDISPRVARSVVQDAFRHVVPADGNAAPPAGTAKPIAGRREFDHPSDRAYVISGTRGPDRDEADRAAAEVLHLALGWRVFEEMTDRLSIAYEAGPLYLDRQGTTPFGFYVGVQPAHLPEAERSLIGIQDAARGPGGLAASLLADAKGAWLGARARSYLRADSVAVRLATNLALGLPIDARERLADAVREVPDHDVRRLAVRLLAPDRRLTIVVGTQTD